MQCGPSREVRAAIEVDLAARPARAGLGHPPEVLVVAGVDVAPLRHPLRRQADLVAPDVPGDLVVRVGRRGQPVGRDAQVARQEVPRPVDRLALEVVAEAPVAEHLEERVVARRPADLLEVVVLAGDAQAALVVDRPGVGALLGAGEDVLELDHARVREEQRLVAGRDEAGAGHDGVAALGEELEEPPADLGGGQRRDPRVVVGRVGRHRPQWYRTATPRAGSRPAVTLPQADSIRKATVGECQGARRGERWPRPGRRLRSTWHPRSGACSCCADERRPPEAFEAPSRRFAGPVRDVAAESGLVEDLPRSRRRPDRGRSGRTSRSIGASFARDASRAPALQGRRRSTGPEPCAPT